MLRFWIDFIACAIQNYVAASVVCMVYPVKAPQSRSFLITYLQLTVSYFLINYIFNATPFERISCGLVIYSLFGMFFFEGSRFRQIIYSILEYMMFLVMDLALQFILFPSCMEIIMKLPPLDQKMLGRNFATASLFLMYVAVEMIVRRKEGRQRAGVLILALTFGLVELIILNILTISNPEDVLESRLIITAVFSMVMIGGFLVVSELFKLILGQQKKQAELEQMALEKIYQYDYYKKALAQGERIRDVRHDMRNQLQTVEYLLCSDSEEDRRRAEEMVKMLSEKAGDVC